ncbi:FtsH protease activity modulator HflK [Candidatus Purcelliella pentastirinorum]|uniref:Protein HflK n=1 Tax=Candidatus Purcelliella pentastirinorum TaxID=472834 RepID=A0AAX3N990_9ENTR|nr:FtsH protease activity modulator HflK [Candidatus Purcelliella pentastirinorum]WDI78510.1 FtsH protease activity modulator HflK [Candidatus Purcelliella pentastirinorum]WDR80461.1 FtsH protease activity modulator HflK [Candidatus Purcelliella pentastirinorum]
MTWKYLSIKNPWGNNENKKNLLSKEKNNIFLLLKYIKNKIKITKKKYKNNKKKIIKTLIILILSIWIINGFYIIKKNEKGILIRLGKFNKLINSGIHWKIIPIDKILKFNRSKIYKISISQTEITSDKNIINVKMITQYNVINPKKYLYTIKNIKNYIKNSIESILLKTIINYNTKKIISINDNKIINSISKKINIFFIKEDVGIKIKKITFKYINLPEKIKKLFNATKNAKKNKEICINKAIYYAKELEKKTNYKIVDIINKSKIYKNNIINRAKKDMLHFNKILSIYRISPKIEKKKIYIETMEKILKQTSNVISNNKNIFMLPINKKKININKKKININKKKININKKKINKLNNIIDQRAYNTCRVNNRKIKDK